MIVSPKIGCPYIVQKTKFTIYWAAKRKSQINDISILTNGEEIPLTIFSVEQLKWLQVPELKTFHKYNSELKFLYRIRVEVHSSLQERTLYDLKVQGDIEYNAVYLIPDISRANILHVTDTHVAYRWDKLEKQMMDKIQNGHKTKSDKFNLSETFVDNYINPNTNFKRLICRANKLHRAGKLDVIVLTGDLVDHAYDEDNWNNFQFFIDLLRGKEHSERLEVPVFTTPGNHDHRSSYYNLQVYGMHHVGISRIIHDVIMKELDTFHKFPLRLNDINSLFIRKRSDRSPLGLYYSLINPYRNYRIDLGKSVRLLAVYSGFDAFVSLRLILQYTKQIIYSIMFNRVVLSGFDAQDVSFVQYNLSHSKTNIVALHGPLFGTLDEFLKTFKNKITLPVETESERKFFKILSRYHLNIDVVLKNRLAMLKTLLNTVSPVVILHGHTHLVRSFMIHKQTHQLSYLKWENLKDYNKYLLQIGTPAVGHMRNMESNEHSAGFRAINADNENIHSSLHYFENGKDKYFLKYSFDENEKKYTFTITFTHKTQNTIYILAYDAKLMKKFTIDSDQIESRKFLEDDSGKTILMLTSNAKTVNLDVKRIKGFRKLRLYFMIKDGKNYKIFPKTIKI